MLSEHVGKFLGPGVTFHKARSGLVGWVSVLENPIPTSASPWNYFPGWVTGVEPSLQGDIGGDHQP